MITQTSFNLRPTACSVRVLLQCFFKLPVEHPFAFMNVAHGVTATTSSTSRVNHQNMAVTLHVIAIMLRKHVCEASDITIVTPYRAQVFAYTRAIKALIAGFEKERPTIDVDFSGINIRTIDSFHGGEASVVFFDMVVAKMRVGNPGFITDPRRLNVALTRGKDATIVVGDTDVFLEQEQKAKEKQRTASNEPDFQPHVKSVLTRLLVRYKNEKAVFTYSESDIANLASLRFVDAKPTADLGREILKEYACNACGELSHRKDDCPLGGKNITHRFTKCNGCEGFGHMESECLLRSCKKCGKLASLCDHIKCDRCFGNGHIAKDCTYEDQRTCGRCGTVGHIIGSEKCPFPKPRNTAPWSDLPLKEKPAM